MNKPFIWFDFGGVLSPPIPTLFDSYHRKTGIRRDQLEAAMTAVARELAVPMLAPIELAILTEREWGRRLRDYLSRSYPAIDLSLARLEDFGAQWFSEIESNHEMVNAMRELRSCGFGVGILTNNVVEWEPHWKRMVAGVGQVDAIVDSCRVGNRKPQLEIFRIAECAAAVPAGAAVLVDDVAENCAAARASGWRTVHFQTNDQTRRDLQAIIAPLALA